MTSNYFHLFAQKTTSKERRHEKYQEAMAKKGKDGIRLHAGQAPMCRMRTACAQHVPCDDVQRQRESGCFPALGSVFLFARVIAVILPSCNESWARPWTYALKCTPLACHA